MYKCSARNGTRQNHLDINISRAAVLGLQLALNRHLFVEETQLWLEEVDVNVDVDFDFDVDPKHKQSQACVSDRT